MQLSITSTPLEAMSILTEGPCHLRPDIHPQCGGSEPDTQPPPEQPWDEYEAEQKRQYGEISVVCNCGKYGTGGNNARVAGQGGKRGILNKIHERQASCTCLRRGGYGKRCKEARWITEYLDVVIKVNAAGEVKGVGFNSLSSWWCSAVREETECIASIAHMHIARS